MRRILFILLSILFFHSCGKRPEANIEDINDNEKRPLTMFSEDDVVRDAIAIFSKKRVDVFEVKKIGNEFLVIDKDGGVDSKQQIKIGDFGLILHKNNSGEWTDKFDGRRIFYYEEGNKLILSEIFEGDSTSYHDFIK